MVEELYSHQGLLVLIDCLNELIDSSGKRQKMINTSKDKVIAAYELARNFMSIEAINEQLRITNQKMFRLKVAGKCNISISKSCMKLCPTQLSLKEQTLIKSYISDLSYQNLPINHIWAEAQRNGLFISKNTFYKYVRQIRGIILAKKNSDDEIKKKTVEAQNVFEILHMDSTTFRCQNGERVYVHFIMDNYSRTILGAVPSYSSKSIVVATNLLQVISKFNLENVPFELYCDDGPENHGSVSKLLNKNELKITKIVANYSTRKSNNMIEAWNKKFKQVVLKKFKVKSFETLKEDLPLMLDYFNNLRLPVLRTLSPNEVITGIKYEDLKIRNKMDEAKNQRLEQNRSSNCNLASMQNMNNFVCQISIAF